MSLCEQCLIQKICDCVDKGDIDQCGYFFNASMFDFEKRQPNTEGTVLEYIVSCAESYHVDLARFFARTFYSGLGEEEILRWLQGSYDNALLNGLAIDD